VKVSIQFYLTLGLIVTIYVIAHQLYLLIFQPEPGTFLYQNTVLSQLFFVPQGVAIIVTWLHRGKAIAYLLAAGIVNEYIVLGSSPDYANFLSILSISVTPLLVMEFFKGCGIDVYQMPGVELNKMWRTIILVTFVCSTLTSLFNAYISSFEAIKNTAAISVLKGIIGSVTGTFLSLLLVYSVFVLFNYYLKHKASK
jgi:hypothetical protein